MFTALFLLATATTVLGVKPIRRAVITKPLLPLLAKQLPTIGATERIALEAGDVWLEGDFFAGKPDWHKLFTTPIKPLTVAEQAFIDGPVEKLLNMFTDWEVMQKRDLPAAVWTFLKKQKFFGLIIPQEHGGLGLSAAAQAAVVTRIATRSITAAVTVMVPNSLGPGELLMKYGTDAQRAHYLPLLADGRELPCFGLTEPHAGSDAANGTSKGIVGYGTINGKKVLGVTLTFSKRYITLAPVATVVGLAFNLEDPKHLLPVGKEGITLALLPRSTKGLVIGARHDPLGIPFQNGPVSGKNVFIPMDYLIGGAAQAGNGWRMLMECLAAGRGISLPSLSVGAAQLAARATSAHAVVRQQFGLSIGKFEGVRERLARIAGLAYGMDALRHLTTGGLDAGHHPAILAAIAKESLTEGMRTTLNDAMDLFGGAGIMRGPANIFATPYTSIPIGITVEGANILTRSLIIFGQGTLRCHPFLQQEVEALASHNVKAFDAAFFGHLGHALKVTGKTFFHALTNGAFASTPAGLTRTQKHAVKQLTRYSAAFALLTEIALIALGGTLKRKEYLTGRFADALSWQMIAAATLRRSADEAKADPATALALKPVEDWLLTHALFKIEDALAGIANNLPRQGVAGLLVTLGYAVAFPSGTRRLSVSDRQVDAAALAMQTPLVRAALSRDVHVPALANEPGLGQLESAYQTSLIDMKSAVSTAARDAAIQVDFFAREAYLKQR